MLQFVFLFLCAFITTAIIMLVGKWLWDKFNWRKKIVKIKIEIREIPDDPEPYYIVRTKYYADGSRKEERYYTEYTFLTRTSNNDETSYWSSGKCTRFNSKSRAMNHYNTERGLLISNGYDMSNYKVVHSTEIVKETKVKTEDDELFELGDKLRKERVPITLPPPH